MRVETEAVNPGATRDSADRGRPAKTDAPRSRMFADHVLHRIETATAAEVHGEPRKSEISP